MKKIILLSLAVVIMATIFFGSAAAQGDVEAYAPDPGTVTIPSTSPANQALSDPARAGWEWWDGEIEYTNIIGWTGTPELGFGTYVSYYVNQDIGFPFVNSVYYIGITAYGIGSPQAGAMYAYLTFLLPPNTNLAITSETPIMCYGGELPLRQFDCNFTLQQMYPGVNQYAIPSGEYGNVWPVPSGAGWSFLIPVKTTTTLTSSALLGEVTNIDGYQVPPKLYPDVPIYVTEGPTLLPGAFNKFEPANGATGVDIYPYLSWYESSGATSYYYCMDTTNDNNCTNWVYETVPIDELLPGTTYYWQIKAVNNNGTTYGDGSLSAFWHFMTKTPAQLFPPGDFSKSAPANSATGVSLSPTLSWSASSTTEIYEYCYDSTNDAACSSWIAIGKEPPNVTLTGLQAGTTYYWHVRARSYDGTTYANGSPGAFWSFKTAESTTKPTNFNKINPADNDIITNLHPVLSWGGIEDITSYEFCYDTSDDDKCSSWVDNAIFTNVSLSDLLSDTTYYWQVRSKNAVGTTYADGSGSAFWAFTTPAPTAKPGVFSKVKPSDGALGISTNPTLSWGSSSGATYYEYCYGLILGESCTWVSNGTEISKTLNGLNPGVTYYWHVRAVNSLGTTYSNGTDKDFWSFKTKAVDESHALFLPMVVK